MTDRDALLAAIRADPDCDTARLVFADWLQEQGEEARAEFIRAQITFENTENEADAFELDERAWRLWQANYAKWEGASGLSNWITRRSLCRGFIESVTCTAADWLKHADAILAQHPVQNVTLTTPVERGHDHRGNGFLNLSAGDQHYTTDLPWRGCLIPPVERVLGAVWKGVTFEVRPVGFQVPHAPVPQDIVDAGDQYFDNLVAGMPMPAEYLTPEGK